MSPIPSRDLLNPHFGAVIAPCNGTGGAYAAHANRRHRRARAVHLNE